MFRLERNVTGLQAAFSATAYRVWRQMAAFYLASRKQYQIVKSQRFERS